jgi:hypothetical protein
MVQRYSHLAPEHLRAAAAALDGILHAKETPTKTEKPVAARNRS